MLRFYQYRVRPTELYWSKPVDRAHYGTCRGISRPIVVSRRAGVHQSEAACNSFDTVAALSPTFDIAASIWLLFFPKCLHHRRAKSLLERSTRLRGGFGKDVFNILLSREGRGQDQRLRAGLVFECSVPIGSSFIVVINPLVVLAAPVPATAFVKLRRFVELVLGQVDQVAAEFGVVSEC